MRIQVTNLVNGELINSFECSATCSTEQAIDNAKFIAVKKLSNGVVKDITYAGSPKFLVSTSADQPLYQIEVVG